MPTTETIVTETAAASHCIHCHEFNCVVIDMHSRQFRCTECEENFTPTDVVRHMLPFRRMLAAMEAVKNAWIVDDSQESDFSSMIS